MSATTPTENPQRHGDSGGGDEGVRLNRVVFFGSSIAIVALALWAIITPGVAYDAIGVLVGWIASGFGWFYILIATVVLAFVVFLGISQYGNTKLGPEHSKPDFSVFSWAAMLFAAGIGTDLMFFSVSEPVTQYLAPPSGEGGTVDAARQATVWTMFHYGITGWGMYALMGIALAYFAYRRNLPLSIRSALYPLFGKRIYGPLGHGVDLAAVLGTIFGIATSLGIGVVQLNYGLTLLLGIPEGLAAQIGLVALAVVIATISAISGVDRGIRRLSELNVLLAIGLALFILFTGRTGFLLNAMVTNVGDYVSSFGSLTMETFAFDQPTEWLNSWTLFFWAWWIAWASFVGLFLARISRGRTIRQFVAGTLIIPFMYVVMWVSIFGNSALAAVRAGNEQFGQTAMNEPQHGFYGLLQQYPAFGFIAGVATLVGLLFYVTSADSGALVMGNLTSYRKTPQDDAKRSVRIFWALAVGLLTLAMLIVGGVPTLQNATVIMGLPFAFVMILVMIGLYKALRLERFRAESRRSSLPALLSGRSQSDAGSSGTGNWRQRLRRTMHHPDRTGMESYLRTVAAPALSEVAEELHRQGVQADVQHSVDDEGLPSVQLTAELEEMPFEYRVAPRQVEIPGFSSEGNGNRSDYYRLEVHLREGGQSYDVMGYASSQLIDDLLDQYERHLEVLRLDREAVE